MNKSEAIRATKNGAIAACISIAMTTIFVVYAIYSDAEGEYWAFWNDPLMFFDIAVMLVLAFGMYVKSRTASVIMFIYFMASKLIIAIETSTYIGICVTLVFLYFYGKAIQGSFVYHKLEKKKIQTIKQHPSGAT